MQKLIIGVSLSEPHIDVDIGGKIFEKSQFYKIDKELRCGDLVLKQNFQLLDQPSRSYKAVPSIYRTSDPFPRFLLPMISHIDRPHGDPE